MCKKICPEMAAALLQRQREVWPLAGRNYDAYPDIRHRLVDMGGFTIEVQYNVSRSPSSAARMDVNYLHHRPCFLCTHRLPAEQEKLPFAERYWLLCNPYPIFPEHFTIVAREHLRQEILPYFEDFLDLAVQMDTYTVFYNGPYSGASAPDHLHFQAVTRYRMPLEEQVANCLATNPPTLLPDTPLYAFTGYLRNGFIFRSPDRKEVSDLFKRLYDAMDTPQGEVEPKMNLFARYEQQGWTIILIPRRCHRPRQRFAEGDDFFLSSPGAADMGGMFITVREEDFVRATPDILRDIYTQVCCSEADILRISSRL